VRCKGGSCLFGNLNQLLRSLHLLMKGSGDAPKPQVLPSSNPEIQTVTASVTLTVSVTMDSSYIHVMKDDWPRSTMTSSTVGRGSKGVGVDLSGQRLHFRAYNLSTAFGSARTIRIGHLQYMHRVSWMHAIDRLELTTRNN